MSARTPPPSSTSAVPHRTLSSAGKAAGRPPCLYIDIHKALGKSAMLRNPLVSTDVSCIMGKMSGVQEKRGSLQLEMADRVSEVDAAETKRDSIRAVIGVRDTLIKTQKVDGEMHAMINDLLEFLDLPQSMEDLHSSSDESDTP